MSQIQLFERCRRCNSYLTDFNSPNCERCPVTRTTLPAAYRPELHRLRQLDFGRMDVRCPHCHGLHWRDEKTSGTNANPLFESCCKQGKVVVPLLSEPPQMLKDLFTGNAERSSKFLSHLRQYNAAFAFTSFGAAGTNVQNRRGGVNMLQVHGELYHLQGPLNNESGADASYAQLYIYDPEYAARIRLKNNSNSELSPELITELSNLLHVLCDNPFVNMYKHGHEMMREEAERQQLNNSVEPFHLRISPEMRMELIVGNDRRTQNLPTADEVAAIVPNEFSEKSFRDIIVTFRQQTNENGHSFNRINETHAAYMPLHYVLLFPRGDLGWNWGLRMNNVDENSSNDDKRLTQRAYYRFRLHTRLNEFSTLFYAKRLFQQYVLDVWGICDQTALSWIRSHQSPLRADVYNGVVDALSGEDYNLNDVGRRYVLPSSYTGGPRFMVKLYQNAMAIVRHLGKPSLFITFTANPRWIEIQNELLPGQSANDRPDLVARVFNMKVRRLLKEIKGDTRRKGIFGGFKGIVRTIEYQKRGLPHLHLLLILDHEHGDFTQSDQVDQVISAELPSKTSDPELYDVVTRNMMHGPCGSINPSAPCMTDDGMGNKSCSKKFPKAFQDITIVNNDGYPSYKRRMNGSSHAIPHPVDRSQIFLMDNSWVVPYNPYLSLKYKAHINVEVCGSVKAIKYINKYIYKGTDQTTLQVSDENDEIKKYLNGRYISPVEAVWRIMEYPMHEEYPSVYQLPVHLPGEQPVVFDTSASQSEINSILDNTHSILMGFFKYCSENESSRRYIYQDFPLHYTWVKTQKKWKIRQTRPAIGRMVYCNPSAGERYYLRLLLTSIPGPTSFDDLKTVNGHLCNTFREACVMHHLIQDDQEWIKSFEEAVLFCSGSSLRSMFTSALLFGELNCPLDIWNQFKEHFCDDLERQMTTSGFRTQLNDEYPTGTFHDDSDLLDYGLYLIEVTLVDQGKSLEEYNLPRVMFNWLELIEREDGQRSNPLIRVETSYNLQQEEEKYNEKYSMLNDDQKNAFDTIISAVNNNEPNRNFFIQGPAGTGKTFLYSTMCHYYRRHSKIVLCVASSGIASLLLPGGRTSHSRFKIPLIINEESFCSIKKNTNLANLIKQTSMVIWDEVPMQHRHCFEAVDRTLRDLLDQPSLLFGGIPFVLGGDFAQIPPVVVRGRRPDVVAASVIKSSLIWPNLKVLGLKDNMRLRQSNENENHLKRWIGDMSYNSIMYGQIHLPVYIRQYRSSSEFIANIYPDSVLQNPTLNSTFFKERAILCPRNSEVEAINQDVISRVAGETITLLSDDQSDMPEGESHSSYPIEYLHSQNLSGLPPHTLVLKVGMPVMLLRNLNPDRGLCNGTRLKIHKIGQYVLVVSVLGSENESCLELIPRFTLSTLEGQLPFILTRKQFPVKPCFAMTINKSQGQSLNVVGVDLRSSVFTHGHLYVALSRSTSSRGLTVLLPENKESTDNVVYPELLINNNQ